MAIRERGKKKAERKEVMRLVSVPFLPPLSPPPHSHFSLLPANPYYLQCKQKAILSAHLSCAWHCRCGRERGPLNLCAQQKATSCVDPWPVVQSHQPATLGFYFIIIFFSHEGHRAGSFPASINNSLLTCHVACCSPSGHDPTRGNTWLQ